MNKKYYIDDVKKILKNTPYTLIEDTFTTTKSGFVVYDINGYKMKMNDDNLLKGKRPEVFHSCNPFTIENIRQYIINNNITTTILSQEYKNNYDKLSWKCSCGNIFERGWNNFYQGAILCPVCSRKLVLKKQNEEEFELIKKYFSDKKYILRSKEYDSHNKNIEFICEKHKKSGIQTVTWNACKYKNAGCKICAREKLALSKRIDESEIQKLTEGKGFKYDHVEYVNDTHHHTYIYFICPKHEKIGLQRKTLADMKKSKSGCNYCCGKQRTHEDFVLLMESINPNIKCLTKYTRAVDKVKCKCMIDGFEWLSSGNNLLNGVGCPECSKRILSETKTKTNEEFVAEINEKYQNRIELLNRYTGAYGKIKCKCNIDSTEWETAATSLLTNSIGCPTCVARATRERCVKSNEDFVKELSIINPNIEPLEQYVNINSKIKCKCKVHNYIWNATPSKILLRKTGCPKCSSYHNEKVLDEILDKWGYKYTIQKRFKNCKDKNTLPFDRYLDDFNVLIEYDGEQHYRPIKRGRYMTEEQAYNIFQTIELHDNIKNEFCKNKNIPLIRIPYWEKDNMEYFLFDKFINLNIIEEIA